VNLRKTEWGKGQRAKVILRFYVGSSGFMQVLAERLDADRKVS
jgi:hypothetical protein